MKRYSVYAEEDDDYDVVTVQIESDNGEWVLHDEAQAEIDRLKAENGALMDATKLLISTKNALDKSVLSDDPSDMFSAMDDHHQALQNLGRLCGAVSHDQN